MSDANAIQFTEAFFQFFESVPRVFTNGFNREVKEISGKRSPYYKQIRGCSPITNSTADTGVVAMSNRTLGIFWIEEDD